jgi:hypothetical protein
VKALIACISSTEFFSNSCIIVFAMRGTQFRTAREVWYPGAMQTLRVPRGGGKASKGAKEPLLVRFAQGEVSERTPVWFIRQAGCYIADFCKFLDNSSFREKLETAKISIELDRIAIYWSGELVDHRLHERFGSFARGRGASRSGCARRAYGFGKQFVLCRVHFYFSPYTFIG